MSPLRYCIAILLLLFFSIGKAQVRTLKYDVVLWGDKIGLMTVTCETRPDGVEFYTLETNSAAKILWINRQNFTHYEVTYKNGKLISSTHKEIENGKLTHWTNINWDGTKYNVDSYKGKRTFTEAVTYSIVSVYFKDIRNVKRIFYEPEADFSEMLHPEPNTWEFKSSDGNRNIYRFENGILKEMEFRVSIATVKMVPHQ